METLETLNQKASQQLSVIQAMDAKLDEVRAYILGLSLPQEQLDAIGAILDSGNTLANSVLAEADALDEPVVPPSE